jgi:hypothetical protein
MPWIFLYLVVIAILRTLKRMRTKRPRSLCADCAFVHMQYGATGRNAVFCTFGGGVRLVTLDVLYCTDYSNRNTQIRPTRIGFVAEIQGMKTEA